MPNKPPTSSDCGRGQWGNPDDDGIHGLNERIEVPSLLTGRAYLNDLIRAYVY